MKKRKGRLATSSFRDFPVKRYGPAILSVGMNRTRLPQQINFIVEIDKLKQVLRQTWLIETVRQENVAEHTWHTTVMVFLLSEYTKDLDLDLLRVVKMLIIHDLVEIDAGDTFIYNKTAKEDQLERELKAANRIFGLLPPDQREEFMELWKEFEFMATPEAQYARAIDALHPLLQAYHNGGRSWKTHNINKSQVIALKRPLMESIEPLWEYAKDLLDKAVTQGILKEKHSRP